MAENELALPPAPSEAPAQIPAQAQAPTPAAQVGPEPRVNVYDPRTTEIGSIPQSQLEEALSYGLQPATTEQVQDYFQEQKYGSLGQQVLTGVEGAAEASTFGGSTALEKALGVKPEDIKARREQNPISHMTGQAAGLIGSTLLGTGEGALLGKAGQAIGRSIGAEGTLAKIGSAAVQSAAENAIFQAGDEFSKSLVDPNQSVENAISNIGLSALLGGGMGAGVGSVSPLWAALGGGKTGAFLKAFTDRVNGGPGVLDSAMNEAIQKAGVDLAPEIRASLMDNPEIRELANTLSQSDTTKSGLSYQESFKNFKQKVSDQLSSYFGKSPEQMAELKNLSTNKIGADVQETLRKELEAKFQPFVDEYSAIESQFEKVPLKKSEKITETVQENPYLSPKEITKTVQGEVDKIQADLAAMAQEKGLLSVAGGENEQFVRRAIRSLENVETLEDLRRVESALKNEARGRPELSFASREVNNVIRSARGNILEGAVGQNAPEMLESLKLTNQKYKFAAETLEDLNDRLHVGNYSGVKSFLKNFTEMTPEKVLSRLATKNDANLIELLKTQFPETFEALRNYRINELLKSSQAGAQEGEVINVNRFLRNFNKASPEVRNVVADAPTQQKLEALEQLMDRLTNPKHNFSNTARTADKLLSAIPGTAVGTIAFLTSHNPLVAASLGFLTKSLGKDVPDAVRLGLLKFLGSEKPIDAAGFKAMIDFIAEAKRGNSLINRSVKGVFQAGKDVLPESLMPTSKDLEKLNKRLEMLSQKPEAMIDMGGHVPYYLPDHGTALGALASRSVNYLNSLKPSEEKKNPLDPKPVISAPQKAKYEKALTIAEQPLSIMKDLRSGSLTSEQVNTMRTLYPSLYQNVGQKLLDQMMDTVSEGKNISYELRQGLSTFLQMPLDSTLTPEAVRSSQLAFQQNSAPSQQGSKSVKGNSLTKLAPTYMTSGQARQVQKMK